jgi:hypothetical protein
VRDHRAKEILTAQGITVRSFNSDLLYEPWDVNDENGQPFTTFDAFWERCLSMPYDPQAPLLPPKRIIPGLLCSSLFFSLTFISTFLIILVISLFASYITHLKLVVLVWILE